jgi:zinc transport system substrate-binding protein
MTKESLIKLLVVTVLLLGMFSFASCAQTPDAKSDKIQIVTTIFPPYDFAKQVGGDLVQVTMLLPPGSESHSYEPSSQDIIAIQNCDLFIYGGGESDTWVDGILDSFDKPINTIKMMDCVAVVEEEIVDGMEAEQGKADSADSEEVEYDEHVWTSPRNSILIAEKIGNALAEIDAGNKDDYQSNTQVYVNDLKILDQSFATFFAQVENKMMIFGDRFPLRYFVEEYGVKYYAAFPGCSNETEPSAATIAFLIDKVKAENVSTIFYIEFSSHKVADSIAEATGAKTALFHTSHIVSQEDMDQGATYLSIMERNLKTLKEGMK